MNYNLLQSENYGDLLDELKGGGELVGTLYGIPIIANRFVPQGQVKIKKAPLNWKTVRIPDNTDILIQHK